VSRTWKILSLDDGPRDCPDPSLPEKESHRDGSEQLHAGEVDGIEVRQSDAFRGVLLVPFVEPADRFLLLDEGLDDVHPAHMLLEEGVKPCELPPHLPVRLPDELLQQLDEKDEGRKDGEGYQGEASVHP
jgi:hypothetical protein